MSAIWLKDPGDTMWFPFDWSQVLATGETITAHATTVDSNLTKLSDTVSGAQVLVQVTGGVNATQSLVTCRITTSASNVYNDEKYVFVVTRQT